MALFLDENGDSGSAFSDLYTICEGDGGLGENPVLGDPSVQQVTYARSSAWATAVRLDTLVNGGTVPPLVPAIPPIVVTALNGGNDPYTGRSIAGNGATYVDTSSGSAIIRVVYDISQNNGLGIQVVDVNGNPIPAPNEVILYHELSHAYHDAIGQNPFPQSACPGNTSDEPAAEIDENVLRALLGIALRDPCNHGVATGGGGTCFTGDTRVALADGEEKRIDLVRKGDLVLGRSGRPNRVIAIDQPFLGDRRLYALNGGSPFITAEHPIMTEAGWKAIDPEATAVENPLFVVGRLRVSDVLVGLKGCAVTAGSPAMDESVEPVLEPISLVSLEARRADPGTPLYNLLVDGDHTYFANGLLVHNKCFILTATTGSSASEEIGRLRQLRDRVAAVSGLGAQLIDAIYGEYFQFSPAIAADLEQDAMAREAVLQIVVRPLFAWYTLAGAVGLERDAGAVKRAVRDVGKACPRYFGSTIAPLLETIRAGEPLPPRAPRLLLDFAPKIQEAAQFRFASWAILDPLVRVWTSTSRHLDVTDEVAQWLATAPLEALGPPRDAAALEREFGGLAEFLDFNTAARQQLGARLLEAWPDAAEALERHGLIEQRGARDE
jgi:hypothetical protein